MQAEVLRNDVWTAEGEDRPLIGGWTAAMIARAIALSGTGLAVEPENLRRFIPAYPVKLGLTRIRNGYYQGTELLELVYMAEDADDECGGLHAIPLRGHNIVTAAEWLPDHAIMVSVDIEGEDARACVFTVAEFRRAYRHWKLRQLARSSWTGTRRVRTAVAIKANAIVIADARRNPTDPVARYRLTNAIEWWRARFAS